MRRDLSPAEQQVLAGLSQFQDFQAMVRTIWLEMNDFCASQAYDVHVSTDGGGVRTMADQLAQWQKGRVQTSPDPAPFGTWKIVGKTVTRAMPGQSAHNFGVACDFALLADAGQAWLPDQHPGWDVLAEVAADNGLQTGKMWVPPFDFGHIQIPGWEKLAASGVLVPIS